MFSSSFVFIFNILFYFGVPVLLIFGFSSTKRKLKETEERNEKEET